MSVADLETMDRKAAHPLTGPVWIEGAQPGDLLEVEYVDVPLGEDPRALDVDAWLRIGDRALSEYLGEGIPAFNLSEAWVAQTGLPFVFAPWIVRPGVDLDDHLPALMRAAEFGRGRIEALSREAAAEWQLPFDECLHYLGTECVYSLGAEMQRALYEYRDRAARVGQCAPDYAPTPIELPHLSCPA